MKDDLISREWLLDVVENTIEWDTERDRNRAIHQVRELTPDVDAVEVVRCKECAFWGLEPKEGRAEAMCLDLMRTTASGFYCARGLRREDGD